MIVHAIGGLANRLRVVFSHRAKHGEIAVQWAPDGEIAGARFDDVFMAIPAVTFLYDDRVPVGGTTDPAPNAPAQWERDYSLLRLRDDHAQRYCALRPGEPYSAIHVRRTDHSAIAAQDPTRDEEFVEFIHHAYRLVYIATDNGTTQRQYINTVLETGRTPVYVAPIHEHERQDMSGQRNTTLADSAIDLFACAGAYTFKGTRHSSFSNLIQTLRGLRTHA